MFILLGQDFPPDAAANQLYQNRKPWWGDNSDWKNVDILQAHGSRVIVDLSSLPPGAKLGGVKYGHGIPGLSPQNGHKRVCCGTRDVSHDPCPPASCPLSSAIASLPAMPFMAQL